LSLSFTNSRLALISGLVTHASVEKAVKITVVVLMNF